jgi:hypothetical protein
MHIQDNAWIRTNHEPDGRDEHNILRTDTHGIVWENAIMSLDRKPRKVRLMNCAFATIGLRGMVSP